MKHIAVLMLLIMCGCSSLTARSEADHRPGTLYPGVEAYISEFKEEPIPEDHPDRAYRDLGCILAPIIIPIVTVDFALSTVYDTIALPYDATRRIMRTEEMESNNHKEGTGE